jgi:hypothetical protein
MLYQVHLAWVGLDLATLVVIDIGCTGSLKIQLSYDHGHDGPYEGVEE